MRQEPAWLITATQLHQQGDLPAAKQMAQANLPQPQARLLLIRCLLDQGYFLEAAQQCAAANADKTSDLGQEIHLWCCFLQLFRAGNAQTVIDAATVILSAGEEGWLTAVAQDLAARANAAAASWGQQPKQTLVASSQQLAAAAASYQRLGYLGEAYTAQMKQGQTLLMQTPPERTQAQKLFRQVQQQALASGHKQAAAEATLRLAELAFATEPTTTAAQLYDQALTLFQQANNELGMADVHQSGGEQMIKAGFDGRGLLQEALARYTAQDNPSGLSRVFSQLAIYHTRQGELVAGADYHHKNIAIAQKMGYAQAEASAQMGLGDLHFRSGDYARSLAAYEQAATLTTSPVAAAMIQLNLANTYTLMNLLDRAEPACRRAIEQLTTIGSKPNLSLAYFILGNILSAKKAWLATLQAWREGLAIDEALGHLHQQAEKLQSIAQATVLQHYQNRHSHIPEAAYEEAIALCEEALTRLASLDDNEAAALRANIRQLQGQTAVTARRYETADTYLVEARNRYAELQMGLQTATSDAMLGLLYYDAANKGQLNLYDSAVAAYKRALAYYQAANMRDQAWPIHYYLANTYFKQGLIAMPTAEAQTAVWHQAQQELEQAADIIDFVRGRFRQANRLAQEEARVGLVANKEKLYRFAIQFSNHYLDDKVTCFNWLQRYKGRAFLDALTLTPFQPPAIAAATLLQQEAQQLATLNQTAHQVEVITILEKLQQLWTEMASAGLAEYVALRRGEPLRWKELPTLLEWNQ